MFIIYVPCTAEVRKDISGQFHNAICCGDVEERIKVLRSVGQGMIHKMKSSNTIM